MAIISLEVNTDIAEAYKFASLQQRQQIQQIVTLLLEKQSENDLVVCQSNFVDNFFLISPLFKGG